MGMKLIMEQDAIEQAVEAYVREMIPGLADGTVIRMDLAATRGPAGFTAEVRLLSVEESESDKPIDPVKESPVKDLPDPEPAAEQVEQSEPVAEEPKPKRAYTRRVPVSGTKPLGVSDQAAPSDADTNVGTPMADVAGIPDAPIETAATEEVEAETVAPEASVEEANLSATNEELVEQAKGNDPVEAPEPATASVPVEADVQPEAEAAPARKSLFANLKKG